MKHVGTVKDFRCGDVMLIIPFGLEYETMELVNQSDKPFSNRRVYLDEYEEV